VTVATILVLSLGIASAALGVEVLRARPTASGPARNAAITTVDEWVRDHAPTGSHLAFGSFLGYEMALTLSDSYRVSHARHGNVAASLSAPDGIKRTGELPSDDWLAIDTAPRNVNEFQAFRGGWLVRVAVGLPTVVGVGVALPPPLLPQPTTTRSAESATAC